MRTALEIKWSRLGYGFRLMLPDVRGIYIQLYGVAIRVFAVDGFAHPVIAGNNLDACRFEVQLRLAEFVKEVSDLEGDVEEPWRIWGRNRRIVADRCYCKVVMVAQSKKCHRFRGPSSCDWKLEKPVVEGFGAFLVAHLDHYVPK